MNKSKATAPGYALEHPSWCQGGHEGPHHESAVVDSWWVRDGVTASVRIIWTDTIDGQPADGGPLVWVDAPEHLEPGDAQRLAVALLQASERIRQEHAACPVPGCGRVGTLQVRLAERRAECTACGTVWADDAEDPGLTFGRLAVWLA